MTSPFRIFRESQLYNQCEECKRTLPLNGLGACVRCRRVLCNSHLHGSFFRRLIVDMGAEPVCLRCRAGTPH